MADGPEDTTAIDEGARAAQDPDGRTAQERQREADEAANREAAATLIKAFGGVRGMVDTTLPGLVFIVIFTITHKTAPSAWSAFGLTAALAAVRLIRRETLQHAFSGVFGVAIGAFIAARSGKAENFYLPGLIYSVGYVLAFLISAAVRWPLIGVLLGPILGENLTWKKNNPGRFRAYMKATWIWAAIMAIKPIVLFPVYFTHDVTLLGWLRVGLGIPPFLLAVYITWMILSKAPPPIKVTDDEDEEQAGEADAAGDAAREDGAGDESAATRATAPH
jgi:Protein of unknown function (DUF3159)